MLHKIDGVNTQNKKKEEEEILQRLNEYVR